MRTACHGSSSSSRAHAHLLTCIYVAPFYACVFFQLATFNRPYYAATARTLADSWSTDSEPQLKRLNARTLAASQNFMSHMRDFSGEIQARKFDAQGLSEGMPFVYRTLDPAYIPFFCSV